MWSCVLATIITSILVNSFASWESGWQTATERRFARSARASQYSVSPLSLRGMLILCANSASVSAWSASQTFAPIDVPARPNCLATTQPRESFGSSLITLRISRAKVKVRSFRSPCKRPIKLHTHPSARPKPISLPEPPLASISMFQRLDVSMFRRFDVWTFGRFDVWTFITAPERDPVSSALSPPATSPPPRPHR